MLITQLTLFGILSSSSERTYLGMKTAHLLLYLEQWLKIINNSVAVEFWLFFPTFSKRHDCIVFADAEGDSILRDTYQEDEEEGRVLLYVERYMKMKLLI